ncbi:MAG: NAD-dependent epimerase/dehydratase family protein, partial [Candidatus Omnitrophota bacterium]|nr:NAD-dependent epimerase/dehydratase family protein [Candidatus Omnitrophota bacterium]
MKKKVLLTGAAGLIGSHLADELLKRGYPVTGIDNLSVGTRNNIKHNFGKPNFKFIKCDILNVRALRRACRGAAIIIHMAAAKKIGEDGSAVRLLAVNVDGTRNVLEEARRHKAKVVFASTSDVYGLSGDIPFRESGNMVIGPPSAKRWAYAVSKMYGEQLAFAYHKEYNIPVVIIRYFGCFSPRASFSWSGGHIPIFIKAVLDDEQIVIHGDGTQTRSMGYVDDLVRGTLLAMESERAVGEIFNIGNDEEMSVIDSVRLVHKISGTGKKLRLRFVPFRKIF